MNRAKVPVQIHSRLLVSVAVLCGLLLGCSRGPPTVRNARDVERLSSDDWYVCARWLADEHIQALERQKKLRHLDFARGWGVRDAKVTDEGIKILASLDLPRLDSIHLGWNSNITDRGLAHIAAMGPLDMLGLTACPKITDAGLVNLARRATIRTLILDGCEGITDEGVLELVNLRGIASIGLDGCLNVTSEAVADLRRALPNAHIRKDDEHWRWRKRNW